MNYSAAINAAFLDPDRDEDAFWGLVRSYVGRIVNKMCPQPMIEDVTQGVMVQLVLHMGRFQSRQGSQFTQWAAGVAKNWTLDMLRRSFRSHEIAASQIGTLIDDEYWMAADLTALSPSLSDAEYEDALAAEDWPDVSTAALRCIAAAVPARDVPLFDGLVQAGHVAGAARIAGISPITGKKRIQAWSQLVASPGVCTYASPGMPISCRPSGRLSEACADGRPAALAIRDSWRFSQKVTTMSAAEFDARAENGYCTHFVVA